MKRVVVMTDISGLGNCSGNANIAIMSAIGVEVCLVPTAVLSAQTGFDDVYFKSLNEESAAIADNLISKNVQVDAVYIGFLTCAEQCKTAMRLIDAFSPKAKIFVDPICGDHAERFSFVDDEMLEQLRLLVQRADIAMPNITELCLLAGGNGEEAVSDISIDHICEYCKNFINDGDMSFIVTGVESDGMIINFIVDRNEYRISANAKHGGSVSGTGDIFASIVCAYMTKGQHILKGCKMASNFINCVLRAEENNMIDRNYGIPYQKYLWLFTRDNM
ncbi:MAG: bifunctional hydroxymethylpyrimidine kinase/phosphomethylpyrimidine kinase [Clostridia bacterium]|nr:bifunctional hydroxymethylpyrimidine kinase/phosphomethylpyrimidine kinase [Clostridia bacterium]